MKLRILILTLTVGLLIGTTAGCGSSGSDDAQGTTTIDYSKGPVPDTEAIATGLQRGFLVSESLATCVAKKVVDKLSDGAKRGVAASDRSKIPSNEVDAVSKEITAAVGTCS